MSDPSPYRVFITYSHRNRDLFDAITAALRAVDLTPTSDQDLDAGPGGFTEQIQAKIAHAHLFVPILTPEAHNRGWVHQEIGYATALKVPCVPICIGKVPDGMIAMNHAVVLDERLSDLEAKLRHVKFAKHVADAGYQWVPPSGCAMEPEVRAQMLVRFADAAHAALGPACVRIQAGFSSFSLPNAPANRPVWIARYGDKFRSHYSYQLFAREREALARHAEAGGLKLVVNHMLNLDPEYGVGVTRTRLCLLVQFLTSLSLPADRVGVALVSQDRPDTFVAVGDWFVAESQAGKPARGVMQTVFTAHAPYVSRRVAEFDQSFADLLADQGSAPGASRDWAVGRLRELIRTLPRHPAWGCDG